MNAHLAPLPIRRFIPIRAPGAAGLSPLQLADRILSLAQAADAAGHPDAASQLLTAMYAVLDRPH